MRKMRKKRWLLLALIVGIVTIPSITQAESGGSGSGSGTVVGNCAEGGWCWDWNILSDFPYPQRAGAEGLRLTIVDKNGNRISGTESYDFFRRATYNKIMSRSVYYNSKKSTCGNKLCVSQNNVSFTSGKYKNIGVMDNIPKIWTQESSPNTRVLDTLRSELQNNSQSFLKILKNNLNYDYAASKNTRNHYLQFEPITDIYKGSDYYVGTATELTAHLKNQGGYGLGLMYAFVQSGAHAIYLSSSAGQDKGEFTFPYVADSDLPNISGNVVTRFFENGGKNGFANGVIWLYRYLPKCEWNNPDHFIDTNGDGKPDSGPGGINCCTDPSITGSHSQADIEFAYPICGACNVNKEPPTSSTPDCGTDGTNKNHTFIDTVSWRCMYLDKNKTQMYKLSTINSYCSVYCKESTSLSLPGSYQGYVLSGNSFIWPNSSKYRLDISGTRQCKVKIDYQKWLKAYNNAGGAKKSELEANIRSCTNDNALNNRKFAYNLKPTISLNDYTGYRNGKDENDSKIGSASLVAKNNPLELTNYRIDYSGGISNFSPSNIENYAKSIWDNKTYVATTANQYTLPNDLYSYTNKKTGIISYRKPKTVENYNNRGYGSLAVDDSTIPNGKEEKKGNKVTINYKNVSANNDKNHFNSLVKAYTCQYNVKKGGPAVCDFNNKEHFKDYNNDGILDSGPNNEDCCVHFKTLWEGDEEKIKELEQKYPQCARVTAKCDYNNPSQYMGAPYGIVPGKGPNGQNCCDDLKANYTRYGLTYSEFLNLERKYQCKSGPSTCTPIPTVNDKSCCTDPKYKDYPVCKDISTGVSVLYREISLAHPFLSEDGKVRTPGANWQSKNNYLVNKYITNNRGVKEENVYTQKPMYVIELDSSKIASIRSYNANHKFDDFNLKCTNGKNCQSRFIETYLTDTGSTCTTNRGHNISGCNKD